jgi:hypothetical protein
MPGSLAEPNSLHCSANVNIPFVVHGCDSLTEGEFAQVPHVGKPAPPSKIVQVIEEMLRPGAHARDEVAGVAVRGS